MRIRYTLTVDEVRDIIAHYFKVTRKDVNLKITETYAGYGMDEHKNHTIECFIDTVKPKDQFFLIENNDLREPRSSSD